MLDTLKIKDEVKNLNKDNRDWLYKRNYCGLTREQFVEEIQKKYEYLFTNSKTLFEMCLKAVLNMEQLEFMLNMIDRVNAGADYHSTSVEVGQKLVDFYVKPLLDNDK
jgi:hypothetical protein